MNSHRITTLYITYDGLLDPLGASQILPYIKGVTAKNNNIVIMSFEKPERFFNGKESMLLDLESHGIKWKPLLFTKKLGSVGKSWDLIRMYIWSLFLSYKYGETFAIFLKRKGTIWSSIIGALIIIFFIIIYFIFK